MMTARVTGATLEIMLVLARRDVKLERVRQKTADHRFARRNYGEDGEQRSASEVLKACLNSSSFFVLLNVSLRLTAGEHIRHAVRGLSVATFSKSFADMVLSNSRWPWRWFKSSRRATQTRTSENTNTSHGSSLMLQFLSRCSFSSIAARKSDAALLLLSSFPLFALGNLVRLGRRIRRRKACIFAFSSPVSQFDVEIFSASSSLRVDTTPSNVPTRQRCGCMISSFSFPCRIPCISTIFCTSW
mmetsp:Transcript_18676/g.26293  ORF Transcript_18676/g.26293 Transcript_18676/m.26293 type:complete len:244 (-) Transcript_18676:234-965(-)